MLVVGQPLKEEATVKGSKVSSGAGPRFQTPAEATSPGTEPNQPLLSVTQLIPLETESCKCQICYAALGAVPIFHTRLLTIAIPKPQTSLAIISAINCCSQLCVIVWRSFCSSLQLRDGQRKYNFHSAMGIISG